MGGEAKMYNGSYKLRTTAVGRTQHIRWNDKYYGLPEVIYMKDPSVDLGPACLVKRRRYFSETETQTVWAFIEPWCNSESGSKTRMAAWTYRKRNCESIPPSGKTWGERNAVRVDSQSNRRTQRPRIKGV